MYGNLNILKSILCIEFNEYFEFYIMLDYILNTKIKIFLQR